MKTKSDLQVELRDKWDELRGLMDYIRLLELEIVEKGDSE